MANPDFIDSDVMIGGLSVRQRYVKISDAGRGTYVPLVVTNQGSEFALKVGDTPVSSTAPVPIVMYGRDDTLAILRALMLDSQRNLTVSLGTRLDAANDSIITGIPAQTGILGSIEITLSATPGTATNLTLPDTAIGIYLYARVNKIRFTVGAAADLEAVGTGGSGDVAASAIKKGGFLNGNTGERILLPAGSGRVLRVNSLVASSVVDVMVF